MPKVSIGIPTYNSEKFVAQAIESVLRQTYEDFELIVSDDGSSDNTDAIISFYAEQDKRIRYIKNSNRLGLFGNFNNCIENSSGEYINILGHDDVMLPRNIEIKTSILDQYPSVGLVVSSVEIIDAYNQPVDSGGWAKFDRDSLEFGRDWIVNKVTANNPICCPFVFLRKSAIEKSGLFNPKYPFVGDFDMWLRIALYADVYFIKEILGQYRWHENNETHNYDYLYEVTEISKIWNEIIEQLNLPFEAIEKLEDRIITELLNRFILTTINQDLETALKMSQVLDCWRGKKRQLSLAVKILGVKVQELHQSLNTLHTSFQWQLEQSQSELQQTRSHLEQSQSKLLYLNTAHKQSQNQLRQCQNRLAAMESSKFWKLRELWFQFKRQLGLKADE